MIAAFFQNAFNTPIGKVSYREDSSSSGSSLQDTDDTSSDDASSSDHSCDEWRHNRDEFFGQTKRNIVFPNSATKLKTDKVARSLKSIEKTVNLVVSCKGHPSKLKYKVNPASTTLPSIVCQASILLLPSNAPERVCGFRVGQGPAKSYYESPALTFAQLGVERNCHLELLTTRSSPWERQILVVDHEHHAGSEPMWQISARMTDSLWRVLMGELDVEVSGLGSSDGHDGDELSHMSFKLRRLEVSKENLYILRRFSATNSISLYEAFRLIANQEQMQPSHATQLYQQILSLLSPSARQNFQLCNLRQNILVKSLLSGNLQHDRAVKVFDVLQYIAWYDGTKSNEQISTWRESGGLNTLLQKIAQSQTCKELHEACFVLQYRNIICFQLLKHKPEDHVAVMQCCGSFSNILLEISQLQVSASFDFNQSNEFCKAVTFARYSLCCLIMVSICAERMVTSQTFPRCFRLSSLLKFVVHQQNKEDWDGYLLPSIAELLAVSNTEQQVKHLGGLWVWFKSLL